MASALTLLGLPLLIHENSQRGNERPPAVAALSARSGDVTAGLQSAAASSTGSKAAADLSSLLNTTSSSDLMPTTTLPLEPTTTYPDGTSDHLARSAPIPDLTKPATGSSQDGLASYRVFGDPKKWGPRPCAHPTLTIGSYVTVTNLNNGKSTTCLIVAQSMAGTDHVIELDAAVFEEIADTNAGEIPVRVTW